MHCTCVLVITAVLVFSWVWKWLWNGNFQMTLGNIDEERICSLIVSRKLGVSSHRANWSSSHRQYRWLVTTTCWWGIARQWSTGYIPWMNLADEMKDLRDITSWFQFERPLINFRNSSRHQHWPTDIVTCSQSFSASAAGCIINGAGQGMKSSVRIFNCAKGFIYRQFLSGALSSSLEIPFSPYARRLNGRHRRWRDSDYPLASSLLL